MKDIIFDGFLEAQNKGINGGDPAILVDETFGQVQNDQSFNGTNWREFSFTAPVSVRDPRIRICGRYQLSIVGKSDSDWVRNLRT